MPSLKKTDTTTIPTRETAKKEGRVCAATRPYVSPNVQPPQRQARYRGITPERDLSNHLEIGTQSFLPESEMPCHFILPDILAPQIDRNLKSEGVPGQAFHE